MHRSWLKTATAALAVMVLCASACRAEAPFVGNWKLLNVDRGNERALVLYEIAEKDGKYTAKVLAAPLIGEGVTIENLKVDAKSMEFVVKSEAGEYHVKGYAPKADAKKKTVVGSIESNSKISLAQFNPTDDKELAAEDAFSTTAEGDQLAAASQIQVAKDKQAALKELVDNRADKPAAYAAAQMLLQSYVSEGGKDEEVLAAATKFVQIGSRFGPEVEKSAAAAACQSLASSEKVSPAAVEFIHTAEKALTDKDSPASALKVLEALALALKKTSKENEAKALAARIDKLDEMLTEELEKGAIPFKVEPFKGRKGNSKRVAVVELFTGAYCPPCVAADVAFDAVLRSYKPADVILLQYHVHIPAPDRLANHDTENRMKFYGNKVQGVPSAFLNGFATNPLGGRKMNGKDSFETLRTALDEALEMDTTADVQLKLERKGNALEITGDVTGVKPSDKLSLRFVLIEDVARYPGGNGQQLHNHVVRSMPGGADGFTIKAKETRQKVTIDLADLRQSLDQYMTKYEETQKFLDSEYPLNLKKLKVIALIQNDDGGEILQAVQVDVPAAK